MSDESVIRANMETMKSFRDKVKGESDSLLPRVAKVVKARNIQTLEQFRAELPVILKAVGRTFQAKHMADIARIAKAGAKMTGELT
jgi:hypothetical protein